MIISGQVPLLSLLIFTPLIGALILLLVHSEQRKLLRVLSFSVSLLTFGLFLALTFLVKDFGGFTLEELYSWIPELHISYHIGVDGISLPLLFLTTLLFPIIVLYSTGVIRKREKEYYILLLITETALLGTFLALDLMLFFFFWESVLIPMYLLIGIWGSARRIYAAVKFVLFTVFGSLIMLLGIIGLYVYSSNFGVPSFDLIRLRNVPMGLEFQTWFFLAFALAFAVKVPIFPFHTWLPDAHTEAPTAGSVILAGLLLKMGSYGLIRFNLNLFPSASALLAPAFMALGVVGILYAGLVCAVQRDLKRLVAFSSIAHMGFIVLGIFSMNEIAQSGAVLQMVNHGLSTGGLFLLVGMLYDRRHTRQIAEFGGLAMPMPLYYNFFLLVVLSSIGLPALNGFVGEFLILAGSFQVNFLLASLATFGVVLSAIYLLYPFKLVFLGRCERPENKALKDLHPREVLALVPVVLVIFMIGLMPKPFLSPIEPAVTSVSQRVARSAALLYLERTDEVGFTDKAYPSPRNDVVEDKER